MGSPIVEGPPIFFDDPPLRWRTNSCASSTVVATKRALDRENPAVSPPRPVRFKTGRARNSPLQRGEHDRRFHLAAIAPGEGAPVQDPVKVHLLQLVVVDGQGDEACKPEEHGQRVEPEHGHWVRDGWEEFRR